MDTNQTHCSDRFTIYIRIESLCPIPEKIIMLNANYISIFLKMKFRFKKNQPVSRKETEAVPGP